MKKILCTQRNLNLAVLCFFVFNTQISFAQNPLVKMWDKRFGGGSSDLSTAFQQTIDEGFIIGGISNSDSSGDKTQHSRGGDDFWIVKINSIGNIEWDKRFGGSSADQLYSLQQTFDKGYILGGTTWSDSGGDVSQHWLTSNDYWIVKTDSLGNKQWDRRYGGTIGDELYSLQQTKDSGYILGGISRSDSSGDKTQNNWDTSSAYANRGDYWIIKINANGDKEWDKRFGGTACDVLSALQQTSDGGFILGGTSQSGSSGDITQQSRDTSMDINYRSDYWIVKVDSLGNKQWDKRFGGADYDCFSSLQQTTDEGYILLGFSYSDSTGDKTQHNWDTSLTTADYWIIKIDSIGDMQWDKRFGGTDQDYFGNIIQTTDRGFLVTGDSKSLIGGDKTENGLNIEQTWVVKTDSLGNKLWDKTIFTPGYDQYGLAMQTIDGCIAFLHWDNGSIGGYKTQYSRGDYDYWISNSATAR